MMPYLEWNNSILFNCEYLTIKTECAHPANSKVCEYKKCPKLRNSRESEN